MKRFAVMFATLITVIFLTGCDFVTVPPTTKGKVLTTSGYLPELYEPGKYTLWGFRKQMILLDTATDTYKESIPVVLQDKLTITVDVRFRGRISGSEQVVHAMFDDIRPGEDNLVNFHEVYGVYGRMVIRNATREVIGQFDVDEVHRNYPKLSEMIAQSLTGSFASTPLEISDITLGGIEYPAVVNAAIEANEERRLQITREKAQAEIDMTKKENELRLAEATRQIRITRAETTRDENRILSEGITPALLKMKQLEVLELMAENAGNNGNSITFIPYESLTSDGAEFRMFQK